MTHDLDLEEFRQLIFFVSLFVGLSHEQLIWVRQLVCH